MWILTFLLLTTFFIAFRQKNQFIGLTLASVKAFLLVCIITALSTEMLSFFYIFNRPVVLGLWGSLTVLMLVLCFKEKELLFKNFSDFKKEAKELFKTLSWGDIIICFIFVVLLSFLAFVCFAFPTNRGDPYHMARIGHWVQQASVLPYPVRDDRQIIALPFDEYLMTHFFYMTGSDRFAPFVQWLTYFYCGLAVSLMCAWLKLKPKFCLYGCFVFWLIPMCILQAVSAQNNMMVTFFVLTAVWFTFKGAEEKTWENIFYCSVAMACGMLTKGTFYLFVIPFGAWAGITLILRDKVYAFKMATVILATAFAVNLPVWWRNTELYGNPISASQAFLEKYKSFTTSKLIITDPSPRKTLMILSKNLLSHTVPSRNSLLPDFNPEVKALFKVLGSDFHAREVNINYDPKKGKHDSVKYVVHENRSGNAFHMYLIIFTTLFFLFSKEKKKMGLYVAVLWGMYLMYCSLIKWSPFRTRLDIPFFAFAIPFVMYMAERYNFKRSFFSTNIAVFMCLFVMSYPYFNHMNKRLVDLDKTRYETQFVTKKTLRKPYTDAAQLMREYNVENMGYYIVNTQWDYMLFPAVWEYAGTNRKIRSVRIRPYYAKLWEKKPFTYEAVLTDEEKFKEKIEPLSEKIIPLFEERKRKRKKEDNKKDQFYFILLKEQSSDYHQ
ncbi:MAG: hypothetical protein J6U64_03175 [Alphaproteobacteria bacterium]|nr:hypothetical protein [Alphaproteobacteria bacterium]